MTFYQMALKVTQSASRQSVLSEPSQGSGLFLLYNTNGVGASAFQPHLDDIASHGLWVLQQTFQISDFKVGLDRHVVKLGKYLKI